MLSLLFALLGSDVPAGGVTVAVFTRLPVALDITVPVALNVTVSPGMIVINSLMLPAPFALLQLEVPVAVQVQVTPPIDAGKVSTTRAPVATFGPAFVIVILYVMLEPGIAVLEAGKSTLVMLKSATGALTAVLEVPVLLLGSASGVSLETCAVFVNGSGPRLPVM